MKPASFSERPQLHSLRVTIEAKWPPGEPAADTHGLTAKSRLAHRVEAWPSVYPDSTLMNIEASAEGLSAEIDLDVVAHHPDQAARQAVQALEYALADAEFRGRVVSHEWLGADPLKRYSAGVTVGMTVWANSEFDAERRARKLVDVADATITQPEVTDAAATADYAPMEEAHDYSVDLLLSLALKANDDSQAEAEAAAIVCRAARGMGEVTSVRPSSIDAVDRVANGPTHNVEVQLTLLISASSSKQAGHTARWLAGDQILYSCPVSVMDVTAEQIEADEQHSSAALHRYAVDMTLSLGVSADSDRNAQYRAMELVNTAVGTQGRVGPATPHPIQEAERTAGGPTHNVEVALGLQLSAGNSVEAERKARGIAANPERYPCPVSVVGMETEPLPVASRTAAPALDDALGSLTA